MQHIEAKYGLLCIYNMYGPILLAFLSSKHKFDDNLILFILKCLQSEQNYEHETVSLSQ